MTPKPSPHHSYHHLPALLASTTKESRVPHLSYLVDHRTLSILSLQGKMTLKVNLPNFPSVHGPGAPFLLPTLSIILTLPTLPSPSIWTLEDLRRLLRQKKHLTFWNTSSLPKLWNLPNPVLSQMNPPAHRSLAPSKTIRRHDIVHRYPQKMTFLLNVLSRNHVRSFNPQNRCHLWKIKQNLWQQVHPERLLACLSLKVIQVFFIGQRLKFISFHRTI
jgi:hypothetical protein